MAVELSRIGELAASGVAGNGAEWFGNTVVEYAATSAAGGAIGQVGGHTAKEAFEGIVDAVKTAQEIAEEMPHPGKLVFDYIQCGVGSPVHGCVAMFHVTQ